MAIIQSPPPPRRSTREDWNTIESVFFVSRIRLSEQAFEKGPHPAGVTNEGEAVYIRNVNVTRTLMTERLNGKLHGIRAH